MKHLNLRTLFFAVSFVFAVGVLAQSPRTFLVKDVGDKPIILHQEKKKRHVAPRDLLPLSAMITIPNGGRLVVYDNVRLCEYIIQESGMMTLAKFLNGSRKESYTKVTFAGLIALLFSDKQEERDMPATIYRGSENDPDNNSIDEYIANIQNVLNDSTLNLPNDYATILKEVLDDMEGQSEVQTDSVTTKE